jgi:hypothetical protein
MAPETVKPKLKEEEEPFVGLYTMYFRNPAVGNSILTKNFRCSGSLREARERAETHCGIMGCKLNFVQPLIANLKIEEEFKLSGGIVKELC